MFTIQVQNTVILYIHPSCKAISLVEIYIANEERKTRFVPNMILRTNITSVTKVNSTWVNLTLGHQNVETVGGPGHSRKLSVLLCSTAFSSFRGKLRKTYSYRLLRFVANRNIILGIILYKSNKIKRCY